MSLFAFLYYVCHWTGNSWQTWRLHVFFLKLQFFQSCFLSKLFTTMCADYGNQCVFARTTNSHMPSFNEAGMVSQNLAKIKICLAVKYDWVSYKKRRSFFCNLGALFIKQKFMVKVQMLILV